VNPIATVGSTSAPSAANAPVADTCAATHRLVLQALDAPADARRIAACVALAGFDTHLAASPAAAQTLLDGARFNALIGAHVDAASLAFAAARHAELLRDAALAQQALSLAGELLVETGAVADGLVHALAGLDLSAELAAPDAASRAWHALAVALIGSGQTRSSLVAAGHALTLAALCPEPIHTTRAMLVSAQAALYLGDLNGVLRMAHQCVQRLVGARTLEELVLRAMAEHHYARALVRSGRMAPARHHAEQSSRHAAASGSATAHAYAAVATALCDAAEGEHTRAWARLETALAQGVPQIVLPALHALTETARSSGDRALLVIARRRLYEETRARQQRAAELQADLARHAVATAPGEQAFGGSTWLQTRAVTPSPPGDPLDRLEETAAALEAGEHPNGALRLYRCGRIAALIARELQWPEAVLQSLERAARLHAIGKLYVPPEISGKAGALTDGERSMIEHSYALGAELLEAAGLREHPILWDVVRGVSERWDGGGPRRLVGEQIPPAARVVAIAAAYVSLTSRRPFRAALSHSDAVAVLRADAGTKFDPLLTELATSALGTAQPTLADLPRQAARASRANRYLQASERLDDLLDRNGDGT
jgi:HD-GYP domain-containing protein (c-di-GMP phosphodiesterase class II)